MKKIIHPTSQISSKARIGVGTTIWQYTHVREKVLIGKNCVIGNGVYIDTGVKIGNNVKIQDRVLIYRKATLEDGVFLGPGVILTNDKYPRAINSKGGIKSFEEFNPGKVLIKKGASVGAGSIILTDLTVGKFAMVGAGSIVTENIPDYGLVLGSPANLIGFVCTCGQTLREYKKLTNKVKMFCIECKKYYLIPNSTFKKIL